ncbi:MAG TPA: hypothetical protein VIZ65_07565 [Cellvibrionaceae bacterium]
MNSKISRSISEPVRTELSWDEKWRAEDHGLIISWEIGRKFRKQKPELAARAERGELPVLDWKGGVDKPIKGEKVGVYFYLAQLQGLRDENLDIDISLEVQLICSRTGVKVTYTNDFNKYGGA